jgi:hypothetical protein
MKEVKYSFEDRLKKTGWWPHLKTLGERSLAEFLGFIDSLISQGYAKGVEDVRQLPMGVSQWREHGKKYKYDKYYQIKWPKEI